MALYSVRNIPFFAIIVAPILVRQSGKISSEIKSGQSIIEVFLYALSTIVALYSAGVLLFAVVLAPILILRSIMIFIENKGNLINSTDTENQNISTISSLAKDFFWLLLPVIFVYGLTVKGYVNHYFDEKIKPVAAVEFLKNEPIQGNMYNEYDFGSYIIFRAYPNYRVFIDGRAEMYGTERLSEYYRIKRIEPGWDKLLEKHDVNFIIIYNHSILSKFLLNNNIWRLIYSDSVANIFLRNTSENKFLIEKYRNIEPIITE
jgi:hypothetical protein